MSEVRTLRFEGIVEAEQYGNPERVLVGGVSVLSAIEEATHYQDRHMIVQIETAGDGLSKHFAEFEGEGKIGAGAEGYSSLTPGENALFYVGEHDLLERLIDLGGQQITLTVAVA